MNRNQIRLAAAAATVVGGFSSIASAQKLGDVFVIALENHNFTQPTSVTSPQQIFGNPAAPYINSLITPGNPNAAHTSYATNYTNAGIGEHPSEPNYIWSEAGTNFNPLSSGPATATNQGAINGYSINSDPDPSAASHNIFTIPHLTGQLNSAGISWKNYQEDVQYSTSPTISASGTGGTAPSGLTVANNAYYGTAQYNYAVKHNPMAFFSDTATQNTYQLSQLTTDLNNNSVGKYNWITPNQYNDMHSTLSGGFTYNGTHYTGDAANIAQGDNFLSQIIPVIEASQAYKNNGAIVIWNDETENGDGPAFTSTEIVISPLAKGNAYASNVALNHSSDLKTYEELFGLPLVNNAIPASETSASGVGYNTVQGSNDLSSLFQAGAIPEPSSLALLSFAGVGLLARRRRA